MNIKILDSQLREYLKTKAKPQDLAEKLSLTSFSVEKVEKYGDDFLYEIEITTNRPDLFSIIGIAKEAAAILPGFGIDATFIPLKLEKQIVNSEFPINIKNDPKLVNRVISVLIEVSTSDSDDLIKKRLEASGIRSLNNVIDVTNYVMRTIGHPTHVFDFDRLHTKELTIREARKGEKIKTLDAKEYTLLGGEIVAANDKNEIVDLLGIMGLSNSVVTNDTKRILYFIDNNEPHRIRNTSMSLGIRTEAATLNEKGIDPNLSMEAMIYGIELFKKYANGKQISKILDIYPNVSKEKTIVVSTDKINKILGVEMDIKKAAKILYDLGFNITVDKNEIKTVIPTNRLEDMEEDVDVIEEIARVYGYHNLPSVLPTGANIRATQFADEFYWEKRIKNAMKYWGFTECYTYSFVSQSLFDGPIESAVTVSNPLTEDFVFMRNSLVPSLLNVIKENKSFDKIKIFEIANVYIKKENNLPDEKLMFSGVIKKDNANFYEVKGILEQVLYDLSIKNLSFKNSKSGGMGSSLYIEKDYLGEIEVLDTNLIDFELDFRVILKYSNYNKEYKPFFKYPPIVEDITLILEENTKTENIINDIKKQSLLIVDVVLKDVYKNSKTFHITYQNPDSNLTKDEVSKIRDSIISSLQKNFRAKIN
ncbi:MAG TPA: phenylalanine--tRNA ligase subunit beta [Candidatus Sulfotelmatobacter sp.]|nr:phenylalanine--tRNA ligase subunit beta [Candidatus Sulfotelmatobacter sp.]